MSNIIDNILSSRIYLTEDSQEEKKSNSTEQEISVEDLKALIDSKRDTFKNLDQSKLKKLYSFIGNIGKGYTSSLIKELEDKKLNKDQIRIVTYIASRENQEASFITAIQDTNNTFKNTVGDEGTNLVKTIADRTKIPSEVVEDLFNITAGKGQRTVGKGEILLKTLLHDTSDPPKLDLQTDEGVVELKVSRAVVSPLPSLSKSLMIDRLNKVFGKEENMNTPWLSLLEVKLREAENPEGALGEFIKISYEGHVEVSTETERLIGKEGFIESLKLDIAYQLASSYITDESIKRIMFISQSGKNYITLEGSKITRNTIDKNFLIEGLSDRNPRMSYKFE